MWTATFRVTLESVLSICKLWLSTLELKMTLSFFFKDFIKVNGDEITFGVSQEEISNCGPSINYFFDNRGGTKPGQPEFKKWLAVFGK